VAPRLAAMPLHAALVPLLVPHAFRHIGMVFLIPAVVAPTLPSEFARPAAYGDLVSGVLALAATLRRVGSVRDALHDLRQARAAVALAEKSTGLTPDVARSSPLRVRRGRPG
jgi:hypothetical protein